jgi:trans-aconitate methyltransferase
VATTQRLVSGEREVLGPGRAQRFLNKRDSALRSRGREFVVTPAARRYERYIGPFTRPIARALVDAMVESGVDRFDRRVGAPIIDLGAGTGILTRLVRSRTRAPIIAIDPSADLLSGVHGMSDVEVLQGTASCVPDRVGAQAVLSNLVITFCADAVADLDVLRRASCGGALLSVSVLASANDVGPFHTFWSSVAEVIPGAWRPADYPHHRFGEPDRLADVVAQAGWSDVNVGRVSSRRAVEAAAAWEWLSSVLPIGVGEPGAGRYAPLTAAERSRVRPVFDQRWTAESQRYDALIATARAT